MGVDVRLQLVDRRSLWSLVEALAAGTQPPASAFDRQPDARAQWEAARAAWTGGDDAAAASAACWLCVVWSAASLPAVALRNVALTHRPIRMPDVYAALDMPSLGAPRSVFDGVSGVRPGIVAALPHRLDADASTGAFIADPGQAGAAVLRVLCDQPGAEAERTTLARILALFRAAERADLQVWEALDGAAIVEAPAGHASSLLWPGLTRPALAAPLSADEWDALEPAWLATRGDLEDLITLVERVAPDDASLAPRACHALARAFGSSRRRAVRYPPYVDDLLPRGLGWLERVMQSASLAGPAVLAHVALERWFQNEAPRGAVPADAWLAAAEVGTADDLQAFVRGVSEGGQAARPALERLVERLGSMRTSGSPEQLQAELRGLYEAYRDRPIADPIARLIAARWYALYRLAPAYARNSKISDYVLRDDRPCGYLLELLLGDGSPDSVELAGMIDGLFAVTPDCPRDDSLFPTAVRSHMPRLRALADAQDADELRRCLDSFLPEQPEEEEEEVEQYDDSPEARAGALVADWHYPFVEQRLRAAAMVEAGEGAALAAAFVRWLATGPSPERISSLGMRLTYLFNERGMTDPAAFDLCIDVARRAFAAHPNANFLYNIACAYVRRGELERSAEVLAEAIRIDPKQADDARGDGDFIPHREHPAFARLLA